MTPRGLEPRTNGLKVHCSAIELEGRARNRREDYPTLLGGVCATCFVHLHYIDWLFMAQSLPEWLLAACLAAIIAAAAYRLGALSRSGALASVVLGTVIVGTGGWWPGVILVVFFVTSSLLSRFTRTSEPQARGNRRDYVQVLANGWGMLLGCVLYAATSWSPWLLFGAGAIAAATADTWSSEIGRTSPSPPRLITTGRIVAAGTSGAISLRGSLASVLGAITIAAISAGTIVALSPQAQSTTAFFGIALAGIGGGLLDSILGATVQEQRWCDSCNTPTEVNPHRCGTPTQHVGGIAGINNDVVNTLCVLAGALVGMVSGIL